MGLGQYTEPCNYVIYTVSNLHGQYNFNHVHGSALHLRRVLVLMCDQSGFWGVSELHC